MGPSVDAQSAAAAEKVGAMVNGNGSYLQDAKA
jgi:hypothetical protein